MMLFKKDYNQQNKTTKYQCNRYGLKYREIKISKFLGHLKINFFFKKLHAVIKVLLCDQISSIFKIIHILAFKVNSNNHGYKKSNHPFNNIIFITRNSITKGINLRLNLINFGIKVRLNLINFAIKLSYLLTSSKNREVKVSGFKK